VLSALRSVALRTGLPPTAHAKSLRRTWRGAAVSVILVGLCLDRHLGLRWWRCGVWWIGCSWVGWGWASAGAACFVGLFACVRQLVELGACFAYVSLARDCVIRRFGRVRAESCGLSGA